MDIIKKRSLVIVIFLLLMSLLTGCGKNSNKNYIGRYKEYHTGWLDRYLEINEDTTASLFDSYDTLTGDWKETDDNKAIELKLTEMGTEIFYAEFAEEDNIDLLKVSGGYYGNKTAYFIREDSDTHNMLANYDVQQVLDALSEGVSINEINTYISNTAIAESEQNNNQTIMNQDVTNSLTFENTETTAVNTTLTINNYKEPETKINGENFEGILKKAQKQSEDVMTAYVARTYTEGENFKKMEYLGYFVLSAKDQSTRNPFEIYLVYKVYVNNKDGDMSYYWYCKFDNIISLGENEYSIDLSDYSTPNNRCESSSGRNWYEGYDSLESLFHNVVALYLETCDYDSDIHDIENEENVSFNNGETFDELLKKAQKKSENVMTSHVVQSFSEGENFKKMDYLGYYALNAKNEQSSNPFKLCLAYKVYVNNDKDGDLSYYWYCKFDKIISLGKDKYSIDLSDYSTPDNRYELPSGYYYYKGYDSLDSLFHNVIAVDVADYNYDSDIHDIESESEVDETSMENKD